MQVIVDQFSRWAIPLMLLGIPLIAWLRGVKVYEVFVVGAQEGFHTVVRIIPFLVGMLVAIGVFRASGAMELLVRAIDPLMSLLGVPGEVLPLAVMRPLSGGGSLGIAAELIGTYGPDSLIGVMASTMQGSADTTFYILTVYFGSVGIRRYRYALALGLVADLSGLLATILIINLLFPH